MGKTQSLNGEAHCVVLSAEKQASKHRLAWCILSEYKSCCWIKGQRYRDKTRACRGSIPSGIGSHSAPRLDAMSRRYARCASQKSEEKARAKRSDMTSQSGSSINGDACLMISFLMNGGLQTDRLSRLKDAYLDIR